MPGCGSVVARAPITTVTLLALNVNVRGSFVIAYLVLLISKIATLTCMLSFLFLVRIKLGLFVHFLLINFGIVHKQTKRKCSLDKTKML